MKPLRYYLFLNAKVNTFLAISIFFVLVQTSEINNFLERQTKI
jgi:hypothetical protein